VPLTAVRHADVAGWVAELALAPATVRYVHRVFSLLLDLAVRDGRLASNPANGVRLPRVERAEKRFLTHQQVRDLADAAGPHATAILMLAYCGLRWGELAALRVSRLDLMRRRLTVAEAVTEVRGHLTWGTPKSHQHRSVPCLASCSTTWPRWSPGEHPRISCSSRAAARCSVTSTSGVTCSTGQQSTPGSTV